MLSEVGKSIIDAVVFIPEHFILTAEGASLSSEVIDYITGIIEQLIVFICGLDLAIDFSVRFNKKFIVDLTMLQFKLQFSWIFAYNADIGCLNCWE